MMHVILLLYGTSHALRAEKVLQQAGIACKLIPIPRHLSSDCGVCLRLAQADGEPARGLLAAAGVDVSPIHPI